MVHICALTSFSEGSCSTLLPFRSGAMFLTFHFIVHLRCFLKVAILHYFPSRVWLDAAVLRCCLFPVHFGHSATSIDLGWSWCNLASDIKFLFTTDASLQARNSGGRSAILRLIKKTYLLQALRYEHRTRLRLKQRCLLPFVSLFIYGLFL